MTEKLVPNNYIEHLSKQGFELDKRIGLGASGGTYLANQGSLKRSVAVKFFDSDFYKNNSIVKKRFEREASILARLQHPNIPYVITTGEIPEREIPYFVMQHIDGTTLEQMIDSKKSLTSSECISVALKILKALEFVHLNKMIHRDIKPSNIMITPDNQCFLIDFSIGVALESGPEGLTRATVFGHKIGTPPYAAPEQLSNAFDADHRADIYSLGIVMLNMLTGTTNLPDAAKPIQGVSRHLLDAILKACDNNPDKRFQKATEFASELSGNSRILNLPRNQPSTAMCVNLNCSSADWSPNGYYKGPSVLNETKDFYCPDCGKELIYQCSKCLSELNMKPFCGNCGHKNFEVPKCKKCDSYLTAKFMDKNTEDTGCEKCTRPLPKAAPSIPVPANDFDDDIPF